MSKILDRLKNLKTGRTSVLRTAEPVVSRSSKTKGQSRKLVILFSAVILASCALAYQFKGQIFTTPKVEAAAAPEVEPQLENQNNEIAIAAYQQGDFSKAAETLEELVKSHPTRAEFHVNLAMAYQQLSKFDKAQQQLQVALTHDPRNSYALNNLGLLAFQTKQEKLAEKSFVQAYELNRLSPEIVLNLASFYEKTGQLQKSVAIYQNYIALQAADPATVNLVKKRLPRLNSLGARGESDKEEEGT